MSLENAETEKEFIEGVRNIFRSYVPESDAWAKPNFFDINSTVIGGLGWSAFNEARNGVDARINIRTAIGESLDILATTPPLNIRRLGQRFAEGIVRVICSSETIIPKGTEFETENGIIYKSQEDVPVVDETAELRVTSCSTGRDQNSIPNRPLSFGLDGKAFSLGIVGGDEVECDEDFRSRIFASSQTTKFYGSAQSYENVIKGYPGVRSVLVDCGTIYVLMDNSFRPKGIPTPQDLENIAAIFEDECLLPANCLGELEPALVHTIAPEIRWCEPPDFCEVEASFNDWLNENFGIGQVVSAVDIQRFLLENYSEYGPSLSTKCDCFYDPCYNGIVGCVELIHGC